MLAGQNIGYWIPMTYLPGTRDVRRVYLHMFVENFGVFVLSDCLFF